MKSKMQNCVTLSVTEAELVSATTCAQDMLFVMRVLESIGLKVKKPMILQVDNKGAKDLAHNWSIGGRTRHVDVREYFLRDLKEDGVILVEWIPSSENSSDLFTKNLSGPTFEKHATVYCGIDEYMQYVEQQGGESGEGVRNKVCFKTHQNPEAHENPEVGVKTTPKWTAGVVKNVKDSKSEDKNKLKNVEDCKSEDKCKCKGSLNAR